MSIKQVINKTSSNKDNFRFYIGSFLDDFYSKYTDNKKRKKMLEEEPVYEEGLEVYLADVAAITESLCNLYNLAKPKWIYNSKYYLNEPHFSKSNDKFILRSVMLIDSPIEFKTRNIFTSRNCITRL